MTTSEGTMMTQWYHVQRSGGGPYYVVRSLRRGGSEDDDEFLCNSAGYRLVFVTGEAAYSAAERANNPWRR